MRSVMGAWLCAQDRILCVTDAPTGPPGALQLDVAILLSCIIIFHGKSISHWVLFALRPEFLVAKTFKTEILGAGPVR